MDKERRKPHVRNDCSTNSLAHRPRRLLRLHVRPLHRRRPRRTGLARAGGAGMTRTTPTGERFTMLAEQWRGRYDLHYFRDQAHAQAWIAATHNPRMVEPTAARGRRHWIVDHPAEDTPERTRHLAARRGHREEYPKGA